jgi:DNA phosphorothioation-dependent restriction protein DptF
MNNLTLKSALSVLSKSSPFSVKTDAQREPDIFDRLKERLFVQLDIETELLRRLHDSTPGDIIFLTGSSGDGKSEILTRAYKEFGGASYRFHLDATHSFAPRESAIDALDRLLDESKGGSVILVIGINVGMLANYGKEGAERHNDVKDAIDIFLKGRKNTARFQFLDFEDYPKFSFQNAANSYSGFAQTLMRRLTEDIESNPYYAIARAQESIGLLDHTLANFNLLARKEVQSRIVETLFRARLERDQFITTRAFLDFLHFLLVGDRLLVDSLFSSVGNELAVRTSEYDPAQQHNAQIDGFILRYELGLKDADLDNFIDELRSKKLLPKQSGKPSAFTLLRLFYMLQGDEVGNNYHRRLSHGFGVDIVREYEKVWLLHKNYSDSAGCKQAVKAFYNGELISAIYTYVNRNAVRLGSDEFHLGEYGRVQLAAKIRLRPDYQALLENQNASSTKFGAHIKAGEKSLGPINMPLSLFELIYKINRGYRPNKYDKSTVILLEELIEKIADEAKKSTELKLCEAGVSYLVTLDDDMLEISEVD